MGKRYGPDWVAKLLGVSKGTVIGWCKDGTMPAVNVARASAKRARYRMSEEDIETFEQRRGNKPVPTSETKSSRRTITRPVKDYFSKGGGN